LKNFLTPWDILDRNIKKDAEKQMKQISEFAAKNGIVFPVNN
jgi:hypothetical protein